MPKATTIVSIEDLKKLTNLKEKTIHVKTWGGDVKIRQLSNKEIIDAQAQTEENNLNFAVEVAHKAITQPKIDKELLLNMSDNLAGVGFIADEVVKFSTQPQK